jgi:holliday junction DNA helicase RuvA
MICALSGTIKRVGEDRVELAVGPVLYELRVPAFDLAELHESIGREVTLHTIFYLQGDATGGSIEPRLVGFLRSGDKRFFERFITVKGIGPRKALRALAAPAGQIAAAIENKDAQFLVGLPEIGRRTAEQIIAELSGKMAEFAAMQGGRAGTAPTSRGTQRTDDERDAIEALVALGERRVDAEHLLERALVVARAGNGKTGSAQGLVQEMLRLRVVRS